jgi:hypothetical protein
MSENWNLHQQIFAACLVSNAAKQQTGTQAYLQEYLYDQLVTLLKKYTGDKWQIGWGPVVWKENPDDTTDGIGNACFVARNKALKFEDGDTYDTYVVSIATTASMYDWISENIAVNYVVDFNAWVSGGIDKPPKKQRGNDEGVFIAYGTAIGVHKLVTEPVPSGLTGVGTGTLIPFLASIPSKGTKVIFTGFSLGGAISPPLALATRQAGLFNKFRKQDVLVYALAAPTPGNQPFSKSFAAQFPFYDGPGYRCWNANIVNSLDAVPQAWCTKRELSPKQNIENIPSIWGSPPLAFVTAGVGVMRLLANVSGVTYFPIRSSYFSSKMPARPTSLNEWANTARQEHESEYVDYIGIMTGLEHFVLDPMKILFGRDSNDEYEPESDEVSLSVE